MLLNLEDIVPNMVTGKVMDKFDCLIYHVRKNTYLLVETDAKEELTKNKVSGDESMER